MAVVPLTVDDGGAEEKMRAFVAGVLKIRTETQGLSKDTLAVADAWKSVKQDSLAALIKETRSAKTENDGFKKTLDGVKKELAATKKALDRSEKGLKLHSRASRDAGDKIGAMAKRLEITNRLVQKHGVNTGVARKAVAAFGKDLDRAEREALGYSRRLDAATKNALQFAAAQRRAAAELRKVATAEKRAAAELRKVATAEKRAAADASRLAAQQRKAADAAHTLVGRLVGLAVAYGAVRVAAREIGGGATEFGEVQTALVGVSKTTDIAGVALRGLNDDVTELATGSVPILKTELLGIGSAVGQIGVRGRANIVEQIELFGKLSAATKDIDAAEAAVELARLRNVQGEGVEATRSQVNVLVELGNKMEANEAQIIRHTSEVGRQTAEFRIGSTEALAFGAALAAIGTRAEGGAAAIGRTFREIQAAVSTGGESLEGFADIAQVSADEFAQAWTEDPVEALGLFLRGLKRFGKDASLALAEVGLGTDEIAKVLPVLAQNFEVLADAQALARAESENLQALNAEASKAFNTQEADLARLTNSYKAQQEALGAGLSPALRQVTKDWADFFQSADATQFGQALGVALTAASVAVLFLAENVDVLTGAFGVFLALKIPAGIAAIGTAWTALTILIAANPLGAILVAIGLALAGVNIAITKLKGGWQKEINAMVKDSGRLHKSVTKVQAALLSTDRAFKMEQLEIARENIERLNEEAAKLGRQKDAEFFAKGASDKFKLLSDQIDNTTHEININKVAVGKLVFSIDKLDTAIDSAAVSVEDLGDNSVDAGRKVKGLTVDLTAAEKAMLAFTNQAKVITLTTEIVATFGGSATAAAEVAKILVDVGGTVDMAQPYLDAKAAVVQLREEFEKANSERVKLAVPFITFDQIMGLLPERDFDPFASLDESFQTHVPPSMIKFQNAIEKSSTAAADTLSGFVGGALQDIVNDGEINFDRLWDSFVNLGIDAIQQMVQKWAQAQFAGKAVSLTSGGAGGGQAGSLISGSQGGGGGGLGGSGAGAGAFSGVLGTVAIFALVFKIVDDMLKRKEAREFGLPIALGFRGGQFQGQQISTGAVDPSQARDMIEVMKAAFNDFRVSMGFLVNEIPELAIKVRNDGKAFTVEVAGIITTGFETWQAAFEDGLRQALSKSTFEDLGENLERALRRVTSLGQDTFEKLIPILIEIDDVNEGLSVSLSRNLHAARQFSTELDITSGELLAAGVALQDVVAWRQREMVAMRQQIELTGLGLAGIGSNVAALETWLDSVKAFNKSLEEEAKRTARLVEPGPRLSPGGFPISPPGGGGVGGRSGVGGGVGGRGGLTGGTTTGVGLGGGKTGGGATPLERELGGLRLQADDTAVAIGGITNAFVENVKTMVSLGTQISALESVLSIADKYGVSLSNRRELEQSLTEMRFKKDVLELNMLLAQLTLSKEILDISDQTIAVWRGAIDEITAAGPGTPSRAGGAGGAGGGRQAARETLRDLFRDLRLEAAETAPGLRDLTNSLKEFQEAQSEARRLGKISADVMRQGWEDFLVVSARVATEGVQGTLDAVAGIGEFQARLRDSTAAFADARSQFDLLIETAETQGLSTAALIEQREALTAAEELAGQQLVASRLVDELAAFGLALDPKTLRQMTTAEVELQRIRLINSVLAAEEAGLLTNATELLEKIAGAEPLDVDAPANRFESLRDLFDSLLTGMDASILGVTQTFDELRANAENLEASNRNLKRIEQERVDALEDLAESSLDAVRGDLAAADGIGSVAAAMNAATERFDQTETELRQVMAAIEAAGGSTDRLADQIRSLDNAERVTADRLAVDLVGAITALGIELPVEQTQRLAAAQFELARFELLAALAAEEFSDVLARAGLDAGQLLLAVVAGPTGGTQGQVTRRAGGVRGRAGGTGGGEDLEALRRQLLATMESFRRMRLGPTASSAADLAQRLKDVMDAAPRAGIELSKVAAAFEVARAAFVKTSLDTIGPPPDFNEAANALAELEETFVDVLAGFLIVGAGAEAMANAGERMELAADAIEGRLKEGIVQRIADLEHLDTTRTNAEVFLESKARFEELAATTLDESLTNAERATALEALAGASQAFESEIKAFLGAGPTAQPLLTAMLETLKQVNAADILVVTDRDILEAQAASLAQIELTTAAQPTATSSASSFSALGTSIDDSLSEITVGGVLDEELILQLIASFEDHGLTVQQLSAVITQMGAIPFAELTERLATSPLEVADTIAGLTAALGAGDFADLVAEFGAIDFADILIEVDTAFGPGALADFTAAISSSTLDFSGLSFDEIVNALGPAGAVAQAIGQEDFQQIVDAIGPVATETAATATALSREDGLMIKKLNSIRLDLDAAGGVQTKLAKGLERTGPGVGDLSVQGLLATLNQNLTVPGFQSGGFMPSAGLAILHDRERVLSAAETRSFDAGGFVEPVPVAIASPQSSGEDVVAEVRSLKEKLDKFMRQEDDWHDTEIEIANLKAQMAQMSNVIAQKSADANEETARNSQGKTDTGT